MLIALFIIGSITLATVIGIVVALKSPVGYEDFRGFHYDWRGKPIEHSHSILYKSFNRFSFTKFRWAKPTVGLAALFLMLLVLSPAAHDSAKLQTTEKASLTVNLASVENNHTKARVSGIQPDKFFSTLCQRFDRIE